METVIGLLGGLVVLIIVVLALVARVLRNGKVFDIETPPCGTFQRKGKGGE